MYDWFFYLFYVFFLDKAGEMGEGISLLCVRYGVFYRTLLCVKRIDTYQPYKFCL